MLIKDTDNKVFGAFTSYEWKAQNHFYGSGEMFVFSFDDEDINQYGCTMKNDKFQYSDEKSILIGGGIK